MPAPTLHRLFGGSPPAVLVRLALVSVLVGAGLTWLGIDPVDLFRALGRLAREIWASGFGALHGFWHDLVTGAAVVVPVWLLARLFDLGGSSRRAAAFDPLPGSAPDAVRSRSIDWRRRNGPTASAS